MSQLIHSCPICGSSCEPHEYFCSDDCYEVWFEDAVEIPGYSILDRHARDAAERLKELDDLPF